jgi:hypothetical protein
LEEYIYDAKHEIYNIFFNNLLDEEITNLRPEYQKMVRSGRQEVAMKNMFSLMNFPGWARFYELYLTNIDEANKRSSNVMDEIMLDITLLPKLREIARVYCSDMNILGEGQYYNRIQEQLLVSGIDITTYQQPQVIFNNDNANEIFSIKK